MHNTQALSRHYRPAAKSNVVAEKAMTNTEDASGASTGFDHADFRRVLGHYPTGVCIVTASDDNGAVGLAVGSFTSVSLEPPLVAFFPDKRSSSWPRIEKIGKFCVNILASDQLELCKQFATSGGDKFAGVSHRISSNGSPILDGVVAWIDCALHAVHEAGDHYIVLGEVVALSVETPSEPLLFLKGQYGEFAKHKRT
jgi:3-hydroxy-9,10-secoandrosta-1,3,5(10)-triene-9,17-dione monooxygenase reductase component